MAKILNNPRKKELKSEVDRGFAIAGTKIDPYSTTTGLGARPKGHGVKRKKDGRLVIVDTNWDDHPRGKR